MRIVGLIMIVVALAGCEGQGGDDDGCLSSSSGCGAGLVCEQREDTWRCVPPSGGAGGSGGSTADATVFSPFPPRDASPQNPPPRDAGAVPGAGGDEPGAGGEPSLGGDPGFGGDPSGFGGFGGDSGFGGDPGPPDLGDFVLEWDEVPDLELGAYQDFVINDGRLGIMVDSLNAVLALPTTVPIFHQVCGQANAYYYPADAQITLCLDLLQEIWFGFAGVEAWTPEEVENASLWTWAFIFLHEAGHGLIHLLNLPAVGREEDAVDEFASIYLIAVGHGEAAVFAAVYWYLTGQDAAPNIALADEHGLNLQRFYNMICLVYGSDPASYGFLVEIFPDFQQRVDRCPAEYAQKRAAWATLLAPWQL